MEWIGIDRAGGGTIFAYGLHKVKKWDGERVEDLEDDWQSLN
jgi:hypothetical protein